MGKETVSRAGKPGIEVNRTMKSPRRPSLKKEELLEKAFEIFVALGFERASIDVISASVGIAKRTLYKRYGDKETLFRAAAEHAIELCILPVAQLHEAEREDLEASLLAIGRLLVSNVLNPAGLRLLRLTNAVSGQMPEIGAHNVHKGINPTIAFLAEHLRRRLGPDLRCYAEPEEAAFAFMNLAVSGPANLVAWGVCLADEFVDGYVQSSVNLFMDGIASEAAGASFGGLMQENHRLKMLLVDAMLQLDMIQQERTAKHISNSAVLLSSK